MSLGSAGAARVAVAKLFWPLFALSVAFLAYSHYRVWIREEGPGVGKFLLVVNTALVVFLWTKKLPF